LVLFAFSLLSMTQNLNRPIKISLLTETFPPEVNGVAFTLAHFARGLSSLGSDVEVLCPKRTSKGDDTELWTEIDLPSRQIPNYPQLRFGLPCGSLLYQNWQDKRPDIIYLATEGPAGFSALRVAKKLNIPVVSGFHTNFDLYLKHYGISIFKPVIDGYLKWFHNRTVGTFVPTDWMISELQNKGYENLFKLSRGVDRQLFSPQKRSDCLRKSWNVGELDRVLLCVSRAAVEKNLELACSLFDQMIQQGKVKAGIIVGDGPERIKLEKRYPSIRFTGCLSKLDLAMHYASSDLFVFPSETETFGNVVTEALSSGLPVLGYDYAAASEYVTSEKNGYLSPLGDVSSLTENLNIALNGSGLFLAKMSRNARASTEIANWQNIIANFYENLTGFLNGRLNSIKVHQTVSNCRMI